MILGCKVSIRGGHFGQCLLQLPSIALPNDVDSIPSPLLKNRDSPGSVLLGSSNFFLQNDAVHVFIRN